MGILLVLVEHHQEELRIDAAHSLVVDNMPVVVMIVLDKNHQSRKERLVEDIRQGIVPH